MAGDYFSQCDPRFGPNALAYFHPRPRSRPDTDPRAHQPAGRPIEVGEPSSTIRTSPSASSARPSDGIIVRGARMLATLPISDEILIFPSTVLKGGDDLKPYALVVRDPERHARALVPVPRAARRRSQPRRPPARLTVRRDGRDGVLRRRARAVGARVPDERRRARQPGVRRRPVPCSTWRTRSSTSRSPRPRRSSGSMQSIGRHDRHRRVPARAGDDRRGR